MPIANPFQQQPDPDECPDAHRDAGAPPSFGRPERRPDERDRTRARTRKERQDTPQKAATAPHSAEQGPAHVKASDDAPGAAEETSAARGESSGEVVPFPGAHVTEPAVEPGGESGGELVPAALTEAARAWWAEAAETVHQALDGSVWRARPPALRDSAVRLQRAEWSGGLPLLRWAGWIYGYPALAVRAVLMGVIWLLDHPTRLIVLAGVIAAALYL